MRLAQALERMEAAAETIVDAQRRAREWDAAHPRDSPPYCFANSYYVVSF